jgi:hypothetical protein
MVEIGEKTAPAVGYYVYYTDGATEYRKGVRWGGFVVDKALTATGFDGVMDVDWENIRSVSRVY